MLLAKEETVLQDMTDRLIEIGSELENYQGNKNPHYIL
jgi:hypothetical protein